MDYVKAFQLNLMFYKSQSAFVKFSDELYERNSVCVVFWRPACGTQAGGSSKEEEQRELLVFSNGISKRITSSLSFFREGHLCFYFISLRLL